VIVAVNDSAVTDAAAAFKSATERFATAAVLEAVFEPVTNAASAAATVAVFVSPAFR